MKRQPKRRMALGVQHALRITAGFFAVLLCLGSDVPQGMAQQAAPPARTIQALIVTGMDLHNWKATAPVVAQELEKDPRIKTTIMQDPHALAPYRPGTGLASTPLDKYDVIVLHFMNWKVPAPGEAARENLRKSVEGGKGLVLIHFACGAWQDWPEFRNLAGRVWDPKLRAHDPRGPFRVDIVNREHPITKGLESFETEDELYTCLAGDRPIQVLATAKSKVDGKDYPMAFCFEYGPSTMLGAALSLSKGGKGRVFHCVLGHDVKALANPPVAELFRRGTAWAAGQAPVAEKR